MTFRGLRLATQFLTRLPVPGVADFSPSELSRSAAWFPLVGSVVGVLVALLHQACSYRMPLLGAAMAVLAWVWLTGALHLDGLADLTDAVAASHRDPQRFHAVLADPRVGAFGVVSIVLVLMVKFAALATVIPAPLSVAPGANASAAARVETAATRPAYDAAAAVPQSTPAPPWPSAPARTLYALPLICAWARLGPLAWSRWLKPLKPGQGERFAWSLHTVWVVFWAALLLAASVAVAPALCAAPLLLVGWGVWLRLRLGGVTGDCLGAGIELTETGLLLILALTSGATAAPL